MNNDELIITEKEAIADSSYTQSQAYDLLLESLAIEYRLDLKNLYHMEYVRAVANYILRWPNYCRRCNGWSGFHGTYDPSPPGVSLGSGYMEDFDPCPECYDKGICCRCGAVMFDPGIADGLDDDKCPKCGFDFTNGEGIPPFFDCPDDLEP